jgi:hypothetical protein
MSTCAERARPRRSPDSLHRREFDFLDHGEPRHQVEYFLAARTTDTAMNDQGWTGLEQRTMTGWRWWTLDELDATTVQYFPDDLPDLVRRADRLV